MKKAIFLVVIGVLLLFGCKKSDDTNDSPSSGLKVEIKGISGWGNFVNISIDQNKTEVKYSKLPSGAPQDSKDKRYYNKKQILFHLFFPNSLLTLFSMRKHIVIVHL
ncbi:hypothetical protein [Sphingobacterium sp. 40-24]|uniref:hypothetical protein n=1 Tax=Sphingobacterium sp. 40-24 TaxID=1895843 RepID=UPI00095CA238|nr:hypothetical protein [Sphingobacterium sp. 40-24]OJZ09758.1 MAG: hypothetical protein BGP15_03595 [Sphingobacterium sp. 40-24]